VQKFVAQQRIVAREPVPLARRERGKRVVHFDDGFG